MKSTTSSAVNLNNIVVVQPKRSILIEVWSAHSSFVIASLRCLDDGGIYKGRVNHRDRAREVDDTRETKVEIPVDFRDVETVDVKAFIQLLRDL